MKRLLKNFGKRCFALRPGLNQFALIAIIAIVAFVYATPVTGIMEPTHNQVYIFVQASDTSPANTMGYMIADVTNLVENGEFQNTLPVFLTNLIYGAAPAPLIEITLGRLFAASNALLMNTDKGQMVNKYPVCDDLHLAGVNNSDMIKYLLTDFTALITARTYGPTAALTNTGLAIFNGERLISASFKGTVFACSESGLAGQELDRNNTLMIPMTQNLRV